MCIWIANDSLQYIFFLCKHMLPLMFHRCYVSNAFIQPGNQLLLASKTNDSSGPPITRVSFPLCLPYGNSKVFTRQSFDGKSNILISCGFNEKSATWDLQTTFILQALMFISDLFFLLRLVLLTIHYLYSCYWTISVFSVNRLTNIYIWCVCTCITV